MEVSRLAMLGCLLYIIPGFYRGFSSLPARHDKIRKFIFAGLRNREQRSNTAS